MVTRNHWESTHTHTHTHVYKILKNKFFIDLLKYTFLFSIIIGFIIYTFFKYKKGFIWSGDGLSQHYVTLNYFQDLLKEFFKTGNFSTFIWNIGNGMDMFGNLAYYIFGDPFSYLCILFSKKYLYIYYYIIVLLRIYFVGVAFLCYCKYKKINYGNVIGAIIYTFCSFLLIASVRHPYFTNALILFPLLMIGIEKIILDNKKIFYIVIIAIITISNFYFAYSFFLIIAIYGLILIINKYKKDGLKAIIKKCLQTLGYSCIGLLISSFILLPTIYAFLTSARSGSMQIYPYTVNYYRNFLPSVISLNGDNWDCLGVHAITLITLPVFIRRRKENNNYPIFLLFIALLFPLLISQLGSVFMGFSYSNNRWSFVISFLFAYMTVVFINSGETINKKDFKYIGVFIALYLIDLYIFRIGINLIIQVNIIIYTCTLLLIFNKEKIEKKLKKLNLYKLGLNLITVIGVIYFAYYLYDVEQNNYVSEFSNFNSINELYSKLNYKVKDFNNVLNYIKENDNTFYRIGKSSNDLENTSIIKDYLSSEFYYSIISNKYDEIANDLQNSQKTVNKEIKQFDFRTKITTLLGNKYYIAPTKIPYGYEKIEGYKGTSIYKNNYSLPFAVLYTNYINNTEYESLDAIEKENSLLKTVVLNDNINVEHNDNVVNYIKENSIKSLDYKVQDNDILKDNTITIKNTNNNKIILDIDETQNSELYIDIKGLKYEPYSKQELINIDLENYEEQIKNNEGLKQQRLTNKQKVINKYRWYQKDYSFNVKVKIGKKEYSEGCDNKRTSPYYFENTEYLINLGYYEKNSDDLTITFSKAGKYTFDSIEVISVPMYDYADDIENLKRSNLEVTDYGNGYLDGIVNTEENGVLQFSTMYQKGWEVYVDGTKVDTFEANKYFLGINIKKGKHKIELKYTTPYLKEGIIISLIGILIFLIIIVRNRKK